MRIEDQVCTLEQAKKLQELGVKTESLFGYAFSNFLPDGQQHIVNCEGIRRLVGISYTEPIPAYTVAELGLLLPKEYYNMRTNDGKFANFLFDHKQKPGLTDIHQETLNGETEAQARANMLINILEAKQQECPLFPDVQPAKTPEA